MAEHDVEAIWQEVWYPIVVTPVVRVGNEIHRGVLNEEQIKRELYDYYMLKQRADELEQDVARLEEDLMWTREWAGEERNV